MTAASTREHRWLVVLVGAAVAGVGLSVAVATGRPILGSRWSLLVLLAAWALMWGVGVVAALRVPRRTAVAVVVVAGVGLRLAALAGPPVSSDDLYRYSWDGRVQVLGVDAYAQPPDSAALVRLREPWLWPDAAGCAALHRPVGCTRINRPSDRTIYPPVAEAWFAALYRLGGIGAKHKVWQVAGVATELGVLALLVIALRRWGRDERWLALYALSPAPVVEIVNNGHVDGLAILATIGALVAARGEQGWRRDTLVGLLIAVAALVKLYPAVVLLAVVGIDAPRPYRATARAGAVAVGVVALAYLPHVAAVGGHVLGYLPGYLTEEHYTTGGRFLLASLTGLPAGLVSGAVLVGVAAWVVWKRPPMPAGCAVLLGALLLATSPVQPWYAVSLLAVATVAGAPAWAAVVIAGYPYFFAVILDDRRARAHGQVAYAAALAVVIAAVLWQGRAVGEAEAVLGEGEEERWLSTSSPR